MPCGYPRHHQLLYVSLAGAAEEMILNAPQRSGATSTADAIKYVREKIIGKDGSRLNDPDVATVVFVITDGKCNDK